MKNLCCFIFLLFSLSAIAKEEQWDFSKFREKAFTIPEGHLEKMIGAKGGNQLFYLPIIISDSTPERYGYAFEDIHFQSKDGTKLHGWIIPTSQKKPLGVVVFSHGNTGSINSHFGFCSWLVKAGYHVLMYDYRGFGKSKGKPTRKGLIEDASAALDFAIAKRSWKQLPIISMGHSLGGAKSLVAIATHPPMKRLKAVISWGSFYSYISIAKHMAGDIATKIVSDELSVRDHVKNINQPLLVVHGKKDQVIPVNHADLIFKAAKAPKQLMLSETGGHNDTMNRENNKMQKQVLSWLAIQLQPAKGASPH